MTGVLNDWSVIPKLGKVSCPTLIINGVDDEVQDSCVAPLFYGVKKAKWIVTWHSGRSQKSTSALLATSSPIRASEMEQRRGRSDALVLRPMAVSIQVKNSRLGLT